GGDDEVARVVLEQRYGGVLARGAEALVHDAGGHHAAQRTLARRRAAAHELVERHEGHASPQAAGAASRASTSGRPTTLYRLSRCTGTKPASTIWRTISRSDVARCLAPACETTFSSIIVLPKSLQPKNSAVCATL